MLCIRLVSNIAPRVSHFSALIVYPALMYAVMFYVILNKRKRLGDCVLTFLASGGRHYAALERVDVDTP